MFAFACCIAPFNSCDNKYSAALISFSLTVSFFNFIPSKSFVYLRTALSPLVFTLSKIFFTVFSKETFSKTGLLVISCHSLFPGCFITFIIIILFNLKNHGSKLSSFQWALSIYPGHHLLSGFRLHSKSHFHL